MGEFLNLALGLGSILIGYIIGRVWQHIVDWMPYRRARRFLRPIMRGQLQVIVSRLMSPEFQEPTGMVGGGDALALRELTTFFNRIGFRRFETLYVDERHLNRQANLVLLGGQDTNQVTSDALELIKPNLMIVDPGPGIRVQVHDLRPESSDGDVVSESLHEYHTTEKVEYGIIIRTRNPFDPSKMIIIIAGAYGYGTWGGVNLIQQESFLRRCEQLDSEASGVKPTKSHHGSRLARLLAFISRGDTHDWGSSLECIFEVKVFDNRPYTPEILVFRSLR